MHCHQNKRAGVAYPRLAARARRNTTQQLVKWSHAKTLIAFRQAERWVAVPAVGLEPTRACAQQLDELPRLPVPPRRHVAIDPWHRNPVARYYPAYDEGLWRRTSHRKRAPRGRKTRTGRGMMTRGLWMHRRKERTGDCTRGTSLCRSFPALAGSISSVVTLCPDVTTTPIMD